MADATFIIPKASLLAQAVELIEDIPMKDRDTKGDVYEYMLSKLSTAGQNGQFRTPRHIIKMMVELMQPKIKDFICDRPVAPPAFWLRPVNTSEPTTKSTIMRPKTASM